jgi:ribonuclease HI
MVRLEYFCTNNQVEYEAILLGLQILSSMGIKHVFQCFNRSLNAYLDKCLKIVALFDDFTVQHVSRDKNIVVNDLAQQASGFQSNRRKFNFLEKPGVSVWQTRQFGFRPMCNTTIYSA